MQIEDHIGAPDKIKPLILKNNNEQPIVFLNCTKYDNDQSKSLRTYQILNILIRLSGIIVRMY